MARRRHPLLFYGRFEVAAALAAFAMFALNRWLWSRGSVLPESAVGTVAAALLLVGPPSFLSGASFPFLAETFVEDAQHRTSTGGRFYGLNLLGAALGVAAGGVLLPLKIGLAGAFTTAAVLQLAGGLLAWRIATRSPRPPSGGTASPPSAGAALASFPPALGWALLAASGLLSLAVQSLLIVWARQVLEGSIYAVCGVLTAFLGGLGLGGLAVAALRRRGCAAPNLLACLAGTSGALRFALPVLGAWLCGRETVLTAGTPAGLLAQALLGCGGVLIPLTFSLGGVFCLWLPCYQLTPQTAGIAIHSFTEVFPFAIALRANLDPLQPVIGLIGSCTPIPMSDDFLAERLRSMTVPSPFFRSAETARLLLVVDPRSAEPDFDGFPVTTDDRPLFAYFGPRQPRGSERLYGFPFLNWIGTRALRPAYPSCDLGSTPPERMLAALRAGNYLYAAAAARESLPGDPRPPAVRERQVRDHLRKTAELWPAAAAVTGDE